jgi:hypothetical protein
LLPARSIERTRNSWPPAEKPVYSLVEAHSANGASSRVHSNFEPVSFEEKAKLGLVAVVVPFGPLASMIVWGALGTEREERVIDFWVAFSEVMFTVGRLIREILSRYRWGSRPRRRQ